MVTVDIEALLYSKVHAVLEWWKHTRGFIEPIQLFPHPGLDYGRFTLKGFILIIYNYFAGKL